MIKQISADQLKPGMYIHDLNGGWLDHSFFSSTFLVRDQVTVDVPDRIASFENYKKWNIDPYQWLPA